MRVATTLTLICAVVTLMVTTPTSAESPELNGTSWTLIDLPGTTLLPEAPVTLRFESGRVGGSDGCNTYSGAFASAGEEFAVTGGLVSTRKACPGPVTKQAEAFLEALARARRARVAAGRLTLLDAGGTALLTLAAQSQELAGTAWEVTSYNNGRQAVVSVLTGTTLTLAFEAGGAVNGSAGCNSYRGSYTASGMVVTIGPLAATRKMCATPERVMEQEAAFLKALAMAERARIDGNRLELRTAKGSLAVSAHRATAPAAESPAEMGGELTYMADAARFTDCATGRGYPVAMEGDWVKAERAYRDAVATPGGPLYVAFEGTIADRPKMEGDGTERTVVVTRFIGAWPGKRCDRAQPR